MRTGLLVLVVMLLSRPLTVLLRRRM